jgi:hypothetical protein
MWFRKLADMELDAVVVGAWLGVDGGEGGLVACFANDRGEGLFHKSQMVQA